MVDQNYSIARRVEQEDRDRPWDIPSTPTELSFAGERYFEMRRRLVLYFDRKNCLTPDELADETFRKLASRVRSDSLIRKSLCLTLLLATLLFSALVIYSAPPTEQAQSNAQEPKVLELGKPMKRDLAGGQQHAYQLALAEGQYVSVTIEPRAINVVARLFGTAGTLVTEVASGNSIRGQVQVELLVESTGSYRLNIEAGEKRAFGGHYEILATEWLTTVENKRALNEASKLDREYNKLHRAGKFDEAFLLAQRVLAIREAVLGPQHLDVADALHKVAVRAHLRDRHAYSHENDHKNAEDLHQRALAIREKALGRDHHEVARSLNLLANFYRAIGDYRQVESLLQRALDIWKKNCGVDSWEAALGLSSLGLFYHDTGDYVKAEQTYRRTLIIQEKVFGPNDPRIGQTLDVLTRLYRIKKDYEQAISVAERCLSMRESALGANHGVVATSLNSLAVLYYYIGDHARAETLFQSALAVWEAIPGAEDVVAIALNNFAATCRDAGDYARAETLFLRALSVWEKKMGTEHWNEATFLVGLAKLYTQTGDYSKAEPLFWRALTLRSKAFSPNHPEVIKAYDHLIGLYLLKGDPAQPVALQARLNSLLEQNIALNLAVGSEQQKLAYLSSLPAYVDQTISVHVGFAPREAIARDLAVTTLLQRKGRVLDAMTDSWATLRRRFEPRHQALLEELSETVAQLASVVLNESSRPQTEDHRRLTASLEEKRARLEAQISRRSMEGRAQLQPVTLAAIQAAIPPATALLEFGVYRPFDPQAVNNKTPFGQPRYVVYVVTKHGEAQWEELGEAKAIDEEISKLRLALRDPKRTDVLQLARAVDEKIMQPIRLLLGDATQLLISPDGALALIPFEVMVDERGKYLIERYSISYVTSGRDLLRMQVGRASQSKPLVLANPLFGEPGWIARSKEGTKTPQLVSFQRKQKRGTKRQSVTTGADLSNVYFAPLGGTAGEAQAIKSLFPEASVLTGTRATESSLKQQAAAPRLLHIATHGFFLTGRRSPSTNVNGDNTRAINANVKIEDPLLRSGLALAGANLHKSSKDDGILTALEASGLNLWGTKLVTLSGCDTGIGEVKNGEGVYGLRRAFVLAGTETLVMSLWPVSDQVTREMMMSYYAGLRKGQGRGEALRRVKLNMLKRRVQEHPFYWASFIQAGEWANLDGQR